MERLDIGRRIRMARLARDWKQKELADAVSFTDSWVSQVERGSIGLDVDQLDSIAAALGVHIYELMSAEDVAADLGARFRPYEGDLTDQDKHEIIELARIKAEYNRAATAERNRDTSPTAGEPRSPDDDGA